MSNTSVNNKRIAKNTLFLYFRTLLVMLVSLYTSRVILQTLGETDFGIYNIVGGVVVLFSFLNQAMATATQRFLNFYLGKGDIDEVKRVFSTSMTVHISISLLVILLSETIGLWFFYTQLNIPQDRFIAAFWAYQLSVLSCCLQIIRIPYNAAIIAYERMSFYAYVSIAEVLLRLGICYLLVIGSADKLILYAILMSLVAFIVNFIYKVYCTKHYETTRYSLFWDSQLYKKLLSFSGWSLMGSVANVGANQGANILFNIFVGVVANAAMGIAQQVTSAVTSFTGSFQTAFIPQLVKSYSSGDKSYFEQLIFNTSRLSFFLIWVMGFPILMCIQPILELWLSDVPQYTAEFSSLYIIYCMIDACSNPLWNAVQAKGDIKKYQMVISAIIISNVIFGYILLIMGFSPITVVLVRVLLNLFQHLYRIYFLKHAIEFNVKKYMRDVMLPITYVVILSIPLPIVAQQILDGWYGHFFVFTISLFIAFTVVIAVGLKREEVSYMVLSLQNRYKRMNKAK